MNTNTALEIHTTHIHTQKRQPHFSAIVSSQSITFIKGQHKRSTRIFKLNSASVQVAVRDIFGCVWVTSLTVVPSIF